ncbi:MAG: L-threonylcarbamoyladenylate synthase [Deltaproteobacteria bacterium]|nr:L-threonylcarbamoyladenylate synthase [Deltaproteobacteria bacterium]
MSRIWKWREAEADALFEEANRLISSGRIIALPTETFYALAAHPFQEKALERLFDIKERPPEKPVLLLIANPAMLTLVATGLPEPGAALIKNFWPGPLTLILSARPELSGRLTGGTGTVGVRQPRQSVTGRLIHFLGHPVTGTSANRSGRPSLASALEVEEEFGEEVDLILDAGPCPGGLPSTIVDLSRQPPRLVRPGAIELARLRDVIPEILVPVETYG